MADTVRLGIDWGKARIGVAAANAGTSFAYPVGTVQAGPDELRGLAAIVAEYEPGAIYVGLPLTLSGERALAAEYVLARAAALAEAVAPVGVRLVDERMSTVTASQQLRQAGRSARSSRPVVDQAAAVVILQYAVDTERATGRAPGAPLEG